MKDHGHTRHPRDSSRVHRLRHARQEGCLRIAASFVLYAGATLAADQVGGVLWIPAWLLCGFLLSGAFSALHYGSHGTLFVGRRANRWAATALGLPVLLNSSLYRSFHLEHHRKTNVSGDTEPGGGVPSLGRYLFYCLNWDFIFGFMRLSTRSIFGRPPYFVNTESARTAVRVDAVLLLVWLGAVATAAAVWPRQTLLFYLLPLQGAWTMNFLLSLPEHYECDERDDGYANTRSTSVRNPFVRWFLWGSNYHAEHHLDPAMPFPELTAFHRDIQHHLKFKSDSYARFHLRLVKSLAARSRRPTAPPGPGRFASFEYPSA